MSDFMTRETKAEVLYNGFLDLKKATTNEVIDSIFTRDLYEGNVLARGWRFYVHLNKQTTVLESHKLIEHCGEKVGKLGKLEKVWKCV